MDMHLLVIIDFVQGDSYFLKKLVMLTIKINTIILCIKSATPSLKPRHVTAYKDLELILGLVAPSNAL